MNKFNQQKISLADLKVENDKLAREVGFWFLHSQLSNNPLKRLVQRITKKT